MPYALRHAETGTLLAGWQRNGYKLDYYGIVQWDDEPVAEAVAEALAQAGVPPEDEAGNPEAWEAVRLTEHEAKMANVKLRNDAGRVVHYRDGALGVGAARDH
ncbi:hypothetical protein [Cohnella cellulosilytica]|uniref:Uncharacterized protein n=1 Tax=Cohnella cellulosilytica TaxID=986710 RepID=A0ABW2F226_9BACL